MGGGFDELGVLGGFPGDLFEGVDEEVELFAGFALGGLDHHGAGDDEGEAGGVGVEAVVDHALAHVAGLDAIFGLELVGEDDLVEGGGLVGEIEGVGELGAEVVGVEDGVFGGLAEAVGAVGEDVGEGADEHAEVAVEHADAARRMWGRL